MPTQPVRLAILALAVLLTPLTAAARGPRWNGLEAVALSPDGKTLVTGGQNRVLFVLDADKLEVRHRLWLGVRVGFLAFNRAGTRLLVEDDANTLHLYDTTTWKSVKTIANADLASVAPDADLLAVRDTQFFAKGEIRLLSLTDGAPRGKIQVDHGLAGFALAADGKSLAVLTRGQETKDEKRLGFGDVPKELQGLKRKEFLQRNDGQAAELIIYDLPNGKPRRQTKLWYTSDFEPVLAFRDDTTYVLNYDNVCAKITKDGDLTLFETPQFVNYAVAVAADGKTIAAGGLGAGSLSGPDGVKRADFQVEKLRGWPEYFAGFTVAPDGTVFGVTSAFRVVKISAQGKIEKTVPVF